MNNTTISIYENDIPPFAEAEMQRLYQSTFSSVAALDAYNRLNNPTCTYVVANDNEPEAILLFQRENNRICVLNEVIKLDAAEIKRFTTTIFERFASTGAITFNAIRTESNTLALPIQHFNCSEDIVVTLPDTVQQYDESLGKATRKNIKRYMNKLTRDFPSLHYEVLTGDQITMQHVQQIFSFNHARMARKKKVSTLDAAEAARLLRLSRDKGMVTVLRIDGRICAGEICSRVGGHYYSHVGAHDPTYDEYRLGTISCYLSICECINRGGKEFHMLWGQYPYKFLLRGVQRDLQHLTIYRSRAHMLLNAPMALKIALQSQVRSIKLARARIREAKARSGIAGLAFLATALIRIFHRPMRLQ